MHGLIVFIALTLPALILLVLHYFPWGSLFAGRQLSRLEAYSLGVTTIISVPFCLQLYASTYVDLSGRVVANLFLLSALSAGLATMLAWGIDALIEKYHQIADERDRAMIMGDVDDGDTQQR